MAKAKRLPSGSWRVQVFVGKEDGKRRYKSFTAESKWEAEYQASQYARNRKERKNVMNITVCEAVTRYIDSKDGVISPATIRGYRSVQNNGLQNLKDVKLKDLTNEAIQQQIRAKIKTHSPKTVLNEHGILTAALNMFYPEFRVNVSLPQKKKRPQTVPTDTQVKELLALAKGKDIELPIILAAMGSLREGEIAPLNVEDILEYGVRVNKDMVRDQYQKWVIKMTPKTDAGNRVAPLPKKVIQMLKEYTKEKESEDRIFVMTPEGIYDRYKKLRKKCGMDKCRFHDLRHYYASVAHLLGVPDQYIMKNGGWTDKGTLQQIYQHALSDHEEMEDKKITGHFEMFLDTKGEESE